MKLCRFATVAAGLALVFAAQAGEPDKRDVHRELNYEYAKLYHAVSTLGHLDEVLLIKFESDETDALCKQIAAFGERAKKELEDLKKANPGISFDDTGRTPLAEDASKRQEKDRLKSYAPITGASGADFERMLLLSQAAVLYQLRFRAEAMADVETSAARRDWLLKKRKELGQLYVRTTKLLDRRYFRAPAHTPLGAAGED